MSSSKAEEKEKDGKRYSGSTSELEPGTDLEKMKTSEEVESIHAINVAPEKHVSPVEDEEQSIGRPKSHRSLSLHLTKSHKSSKKENIQKEIYPVTNIEDGLVGWDDQDDPMHPRNYPDSRKWVILAFVSGITFLSPLSSSVVAPGISIMDEEFHNTSSILGTLTISIFVLGFAVGPIFLGPLSEIYGRRPVLAISNFFLTAWQLAGALSPNLGSLIAFRFLGGLGGSACLAIGGGVIADMFPVQQRGTANAMYTLGPLFGPVIGPIIGGFIAARAGWRWVYWVLLIACGTFSVGYAIFGKETNAAVLIRKKTAKLRKETGQDLKSAYDVGKDTRKMTIIKAGLFRPFRMFLSSPLLPLLAFYMSFIFGLVYLIFTTIPTLFIEVYHWHAELTGLAYLGVAGGFMSGMVVVAKTSDRTVVGMTKKNNGVYKAEYRLYPCVYYAFFVPISFFWYGWAAEKKTHWIVPILGLLPFGFGTMGIFAMIQTYFIDAAGVYAASAMAGLTAVRCIFAAFLPLAGPPMFAKLGLGWGNSLLGFVALGLIPVPAVIYKYGFKLREKYPIRLD